VTGTERNLLHGFALRLDAETRRARTAADPSRHLANVARLQGLIRETLAKETDLTPSESRLLERVK